jgi:serine/threonine-protein kinase
VTRKTTTTLRPTPKALASIITLAFAHGLWTLFQWTQLVAARTGGSSFCGIGESTVCSELWDSGFATAIQEWTGLPVAGWGLVWSLAAFGLPLAVLASRVRSDDTEPSSAWVATIWMAVGGVVSILVLISASILHGDLCATCAVTYTIVAAYAAVCFVQTPPQTLPLTKGISLASGAMALAFVLLFVPGLRTPMTEAAEGRKALLEVAAEEQQAETTSQAGRSPEPTVAGVGRLLAQLPPQLRQAFADELLRYASAEPVALRPSRALIGPRDAPVRIIEFTDVLCGHCANLHETLSQLRSSLPDPAFSLEPRHFPLDSGCNPTLDSEPALPVRCLAAKASICLEGRLEAFDFDGRMYEHQRELTEEMVYELAAPLISPEELRACVSDPTTEARLQDDIAWATELGIEGTPLLLLNGRPVAPFGPLLYALIVTGGDPSHPVFADLPEGVIRDPHEGHDH